MYQLILILGDSVVVLKGEYIDAEIKACEVGKS